MGTFIIVLLACHYKIELLKLFEGSVSAVSKFSALQMNFIFFLPILKVLHRNIYLHLIDFMYFKCFIK